MCHKRISLILLAGFLGGCVNGLFGAGGGMVLVPLLGLGAVLSEEEVFPASVSIILPICLISLGRYMHLNAVDWGCALPYLLGSGAGGILSGKFGNKIPVKWLHRVLGLMILWGGIRYLC